VTAFGSDWSTVAVSDEAGTRRLAGDLAAIVAPGDVIALHGDLGVGKSAFARALIRALAGEPDLEVPSPTFTLVQTYATPRLVVGHFDLYRLSDPDELLEIGFDDALDTALTLIEWPDRAGDRLPEDRLDIEIGMDGTAEGRRFRFRASSPGWQVRLDETLAVRHLLDGIGLADAERRHLQGDASTRRFERASAGDRSVVVMRWPRLAVRPPLADGLPYEALVHQTDSLLAFRAIADTLRRRGFRAPAILGEDGARRLMLIEDLGGEPIVRDGAPIAERYLAAARRLADFAREPWPAEATTDAGAVWPMPAYDRRALLTEASLFVDWFVPDLVKQPLDAGRRAEWRTIWDRLLARFDGERSVWVLKDYHSPNILWQEGADDPIGLIDFQDALLGPAAYDVASLLTDARVDVPDELAETLFEAYVERRRGFDPAFDREAFEEAVVILGAQRNAKIAGRFVEYAVRTGRDAHLRFLPRVRRNLEKALRHPVLADLKLWYERLEATP
jgi:tRNA threonylcarbamoyl adenosine modification protein YjeE